MPLQESRAVTSALPIHLTIARSPLTRSNNAMQIMSDRSQRYAAKRRAVKRSWRGVSQRCRSLLYDKPPNGLEHPGKANKEASKRHSDTIRLAKTYSKVAGIAFAARRRVRCRSTCKTGVDHAARSRCGRSIIGRSGRHGASRTRCVHPDWILSPAWVTCTAGALTGGVTVAVTNALVVCLGTDEVWKSLGVLRGVRLQTIAAYTRVRQGRLRTGLERLSM